MASAAQVHVEWRPTDKAVAMPSTFDMSHAHTPLLVSDIVGQRGTVVCIERATLSDAVDLLTLHDRTAAGVVDDKGALVGVITENDLVLAYANGTPAATQVKAWLATGQARFSSAAVPELTVRPSVTLLDAALRMRAHSDTDIASHHLVVSGENGDFHGVLSCLDLARALCGVGAPPSALHKVRSTPVWEVMKPRMDVLWCGAGESLGQTLASMAAARQNCVLVADPGNETSNKPLGIITPRDALLAFVEHVPLSIDLGRWLRGIQSHWEARSIDASALVAVAAATMASGSIHHLLVTLAGSEVIGVVSSADLVQAITSLEDIPLADTPLEEEAAKMEA